MFSSALISKFVSTAGLAPRLYAKAAQPILSKFVEKVHLNIICGPRNKPRNKPLYFGGQFASRCVVVVVRVVLGIC